MKTCEKCKVEKEDSFFAKNQRWCRACCKDYREAHKEEKRAYRAAYWAKNKEKLTKYHKRYRAKNIERIKERDKKYHKEHKRPQTPERKASANNYQKIRKQTDMVYKIRTVVSKQIGTILKENNSSKGGNSCFLYLLYSAEELKLYLEQHFEPWMNWQNYGKYNAKTWNDDDQTTWKWNIDHIIPQVDLPYTSMEDDNFKKCWALSNLRPYSAKQNLLDGPRRK